jgi:hypothetical protein
MAYAADNFATSGCEMKVKKAGLWLISDWEQAGYEQRCSQSRAGVSVPSHIAVLRQQRPLQPFLFVWLDFSASLHRN